MAGQLSISVAFECINCGERLPVEVDGEHIAPAWDGRHECYGDRTKTIGSISQQGISLYHPAQDRLSIVVE